MVLKETMPRFSYFAGCFFLGSPPSNYTGSISSITSQSAGNNHNDEVSADTSDTETCLSLERERNKAKLDRWSYQQIPVLRTK